MSYCLLLCLYTDTYIVKGSFVSLRIFLLFLIYLYTRLACSSLGHFDYCILYGNGLFLLTVFQLLRAFKLINELRFDRRSEVPSI